MNNEIKEEIIILLTEARNKITKAIIMYNQNDEDTIYLQTMRSLIDNEIHDLTKDKEYDI